MNFAGQASLRCFKMTVEMIGESFLRFMIPCDDDIFLVECDSDVFFYTSKDEVTATMCHFFGPRTLVALEITLPHIDGS